MHRGKPNETIDPLEIVRWCKDPSRTVEDTHHEGAEIQAERREEKHGAGLLRLGQNRLQSQVRDSACRLPSLKQEQIEAVPMPKEIRPLTKNLAMCH